MKTGELAVMALGWVHAYIATLILDARAENIFITNLKFLQEGWHPLDLCICVIACSMYKFRKDIAIHMIIEIQ